LRFDELDLTLIDSAKVFHFGTLSLTDEPARNTTQKAVEYAKKGGKLITFDPNLRPSLWSSLDEARVQILWGLKHADIVKISDDEAGFLWGCTGSEGANRVFDDYGVKLVMLTKGPDGCCLKNRNGLVSAPCPPLKAIDTTGAGDILGGSAVSRILKIEKQPDELTLEDLAGIAAFASAAASLSTQKYGGIPSIPSETEIAAIL
jgi:sugar/nucleoside kinase (ribokinase family)